jgi:hypothetical protein
MTAAPGVNNQVDETSGITIKLKITYEATTILTICCM